MKRIGISTDCLCDLPLDYLMANDISVLQYYIHTATGRFWTETEITSDNVLEYLETGNTYLRSNAPEPGECRTYLEEILTRYDEVIHITTSDKIGMSYPNAKAAVDMMGEDAKGVTLINSGSVSAGLGHMVMLTVSLRDSGKSADEIAQACDAMRSRICGSFIVPNADYLNRMGYANRVMSFLCSLFKIHPVICAKDGKLVIKTFLMGNYEKAVMRYIRNEFKNSDRIDKRQLFITHAGCQTKVLAQVRAKADSLCKFDKVTVTKASAVISSYCGPETVGVMFVYQ